MAGAEKEGQDAQGVVLQALTFLNHDERGRLPRSMDIDDDCLGLAGDTGRCAAGKAGSCEAKGELQRDLEKGKGPVAVSDRKKRKVLKCFRVTHGAWERVWVALLAAVFCTGVILSVVALVARYEGWMTSSKEVLPSKIVVGWGFACVSPQQNFGANNVNACSDKENFVGISDALSVRVGQVGIGTVTTLASSWFLPIVAFFIVPLMLGWRREDNCLHGYTSCIVWVVLGCTLIVLSLMFYKTAQLDVERTTTGVVDLVCDQTTICRAVQGFQDCIGARCRETIKGKLVCEKFEACEFVPSKLPCSDHDATCRLEPGWALVCAVLAGVMWVIMGVGGMIGSVLIATNL